MFGISTVISFFIRNTNIIKYFGILVILSGIFYKAYSIYSNYTQLENDLAKTQTELITTKKILRETIIKNKNLNVALQLKEKYQEQVLKEIESKHKLEIENIKKYETIKEKTYYEKDGDVAPVLINTINRLFSKTK